MPEPLFGKYRGVVRNNRDPERRGRLKLDVPSIDTGMLDWAEPCLTVLEVRNSETFIPPPIGAEVWVEFEAGSLNHPIWTGCAWPLSRRAWEAQSEEDW